MSCTNVMMTRVLRFVFLLTAMVAIASWASSSPSPTHRRRYLSASVAAKGSRRYDRGSLKGCNGKPSQIEAASRKTGHQPSWFRQRKACLDQSADVSSTGSRRGFLGRRRDPDGSKTTEDKSADDKRQSGLFRWRRQSADQKEDWESSTGKKKRQSEPEKDAKEGPTDTTSSKQKGSKGWFRMTREHDDDQSKKREKSEDESSSGNKKQQFEPAKDAKEGPKHTAFSGEKKPSKGWFRLTRKRDDDASKMREKSDNESPTVDEEEGHIVDKEEGRLADEPADKKSGGPAQKTASGTLADATSKETNKESWWNRRGKRESKNTTKTTLPSSAESSETKKESSDDQGLPKNVTSPASPPSLVNQTSPPLPQPSGIIITGMQPPPGFGSGGAPPYRYYRRGGPVPQPPQQPSPSSLVLMELVASVLATVSRLWFLTWLTRRLASQEESIEPTQHYVWERLNDKYQRDSAALATAIQMPPTGISALRWKREHMRKVHERRRPASEDLSAVFTRTVVVVEISDDPKEVNLEQLAPVVTFLLLQHRRRAFGTHKDSDDTPMELEVVFLVQSPGGSVATYGLAAAQMERLANVDGITTTVCVDKYAASGGYMIASQAHKLIAAPFATLGSIGVILEGLNFNELAKRYGIQPVIVKAGTSKNPVSTFGEITPRDMRNEEKRLAKVHDAFKELVVKGRPGLEAHIAHIADGTVYLGQEALDLQMVDSVMTSEDYLMERILAGDRVLKLHRSYQARLPLGRVKLSPLDLLPHLKTWVQSLVDHPERISALVSRLVQVGGAVGFAQHLHQSFTEMNRNNGRP